MDRRRNQGRKGAIINRNKGKSAAKKRKVEETKTKKFGPDYIKFITDDYNKAADYWNNHKDELDRLTGKTVSDDQVPSTSRGGGSNNAYWDLPGDGGQDDQVGNSQSDDEMAAAAEIVEGGMDGDHNYAAVGGGGNQRSDQGGAQAGGGGFGSSTGNWEGGCYWHAGGFTTKRTYQCIIPAINNHDYTRLASSDAGNYYLGYATPWAVLNTNSYSCHMNPRDFQHLINTCARWKPKYIKIKMQNIQLKTKIASPVSINNNLTATMQIMEKNSNELPQSLDPYEEGKPSAIAIDPYRPKPYTYFAECDGTGDANSYTSFFMLEHMDSAMKKCEDSYGTSFTFKCGWVDNMRMNIAMPFWYQPNLDTFWGMNGDTVPVTHPQRLNKRKLWRAGPYQFNTNTSQATYDKPSELINGVLQIAAPNATDANPLHTPLIRTQLGDNTTPVNLIRRTVGTGTNLADGINIPATNSPTETTSVDNGEGALQPNMVLEDAPANWIGPIWQRKPNVDHIVQPLSYLGAVLVDEEPPLLLAKVTPQPTDTIGEYENVYTTFTLNLEMGWDTVPFKTHRYNPINMYSFSSADAAANNFLPDNTGKIKTAVQLTGKQLYKLP